MRCSLSASRHRNAGRAARIAGCVCMFVFGSVWRLLTAAAADCALCCCLHITYCCRLIQAATHLPPLSTDTRSRRRSPRRNASRSLLSTAAARAAKRTKRPSSSSSWGTAKRRMRTRTRRRAAVADAPAVPATKWPRCVGRGCSSAGYAVVGCCCFGCAIIMSCHRLLRQAAAPSLLQLRFCLFIIFRRVGSCCRLLRVAAVVDQHYCGCCCFSAERHPTAHHPQPSTHPPPPALQATSFALQQDGEAWDAEPFDCSAGPDKPMMELVAGSRIFYQVCYASAYVLCLGSALSQ